MAAVNLGKKESVEIISGRDNIVIVNNFESIRGGRSLDVTGFEKPVIHAGHPIIRETATGDYKPLPLNATGDGFGALPAGHTYGGILIASIPREKAFAGIMVRGTVKRCLQRHQNH